MPSAPPRKKPRSPEMEQHLRNLQYKYTFYDKDGNVTDVCPWGG